MRARCRFGGTASSLPFGASRLTIRGTPTFTSAKLQRRVLNRPLPTPRAPLMAVEPIPARAASSSPLVVESVPAAIAGAVPVAPEIAQPAAEPAQQPAAHAEPGPQPDAPAASEPGEPEIRYVSMFHRNPQLPPHSVHEELRAGPGAEREIPVFKMQRSSEKPVSALKDSAYEGLAFPWVFPQGGNTFPAERPHKISKREYLQSRLLADASRSRILQADHDLGYLFLASHILDSEAVNSGATTALRQVSRDSRHSGNASSRSRSAPPPRTRPLTVADILSDEKKLEVDGKYFRFFKQIRGSTPYWDETREFLFAMCRRFGPPTFFMTLSANDLGWIDMAMACGKLTREEAEKLSPAQRRELVVKNPDLAARHFEHRGRAFIKHVLNGERKPLGEILEYFIRVEFQSRGSPHLHCLLWVKNAPDLSTPAGLMPAFWTVSSCLVGPQSCFRCLSRVSQGSLGCLALWTSTSRPRCPPRTTTLTCTSW